MPDWLNAMPECGLEKMRINPSVFDIKKYKVQRKMRRPASGLMRIWLIFSGWCVVSSGPSVVMMIMRLSSVVF